MPERKRAIVVTTINAPTKAMRELSRGALAAGNGIIVVGDTKTPAEFALPGCRFLSIDEQSRMFPELCSILPVRHYARKNIGYLLALREGAREIQETDDDNIPLAGFWKVWPAAAEVELIGGAGPWFNVYSLFSDENIWPRGLPLESLAQASRRSEGSQLTSSRCLILQGLADGNPDVDAVYRLVNKLPIVFRHRDPVMLAPGTWCPFNSQNTIFRADVFALTYLPSHCSFRMTDIWRSFVAQRCLWGMGEGVVFHAPTVTQERNEHDLLKDFEDEIPGYLMNDKIRRALEPVAIDRDVVGSLVRCYESLIQQHLLSADEMPIVRAWCREVSRNSSPT